MRIDKYLWSIRLFKTRTEASEACRLGRVRIGDDIVKAAKELKPGDVLLAINGQEIEDVFDYHFLIHDQFLHSPHRYLRY